MRLVRRKAVRRVRASKKILLFTLMFIAFTVNSYGRYFKSINSRYQGQIAEPIIKVQGVSTKIINEDFNRNVGEIEYLFDIKNFEIEQDGYKRITEVDFNYEIYLEETNQNFPVKYKLYDMSTGEELLNGNNRTLPKHISRDKEYIKKYKLIAKWDESKVLIGKEDVIDIKIKVTQSSKGVLI